MSDLSVIIGETYTGQHFSYVTANGTRTIVILRQGEEGKTLQPHKQAAY